MTDSESKPNVKLFTDGACLGNPGRGGWAYLLRHEASSKSKEGSGGEPETTNNRMELTAAIRGLEELTKPAVVELISDSQYVLHGLRDWMPNWKKKGWKRGGNKPVLNAELWKKLDELISIHDVTFTWVRGHTGHPENERCDELASAEAANQ